MSTIPPENLTRTLHAEYLRLVGGDLSLTLDRMYWWGQWAHHGWGVEELRFVIGHIESQIKKGRRWPGALRWSRLIQQADNFEEELNLARAEKRNAKPAPSSKDRVLEQARPTVSNEPVRDTAKPVGQVDWIKALRESVG